MRLVCSCENQPAKIYRLMKVQSFSDGILGSPVGMTAGIRAFKEITVPDRTAYGTIRSCCPLEHREWDMERNFIFRRLRSFLRNGFGKCCPDFKTFEIFPGNVEYIP